MAKGGAREEAGPAVSCVARTRVVSATGLRRTGSAAGVKLLSVLVATEANVLLPPTMELAALAAEPVSRSAAGTAAGAPNRAISRASRTGNDRSAPRCVFVAMTPP